MEIRGILIFIFMCVWPLILALIIDIAFFYEGTKNAKQVVVLLTISELLLLYLINNW